MVVRAWRWVLVPALLTLLVTVLRLVGELRGWSPHWFSNAPGGGAALVGIVWLPAVFGPWFGWRLARQQERPRRPLRALGIQCLAAILFVSTFVCVHRVLRPDASTRSGLQVQILAMGVGSALSAVPGVLAWPALGRVNLLYGLLARAPVVAITFVAVACDWGTHYEKLGPHDYAGLLPMERAAWLAFTQLTIWPACTVVVGGLLGLLAAACGPRRARPAP